MRTVQTSGEGELAAGFQMCIARIGSSMGVAFQGLVAHSSTPSVRPGIQSSLCTDISAGADDAWRSVGETMSSSPVVELHSYQQVRSLGRMGAEVEGAPLAYYAVDFHEEPVALSGQLLADQAEYLVQAIDAIRTLHQGSYGMRPPITVVAHSMGAVVARMAMLHSQLPWDAIGLLFTLSGPHQACVHDTAVRLRTHCENAHFLRAFLQGTNKGGLVRRRCFRHMQRGLATRHCWARFQYPSGVRGCWR